MKWIICILLWCMSLGIYGQNDSVYLKKYDWITGVRDTLPEWVTKVQGNGRFVGVSDPGLQVEVARKQALLRAWMLFQLNRGVKVSMVKDYFVQNEEYFGHDISKDKLISLAKLEFKEYPVSFKIVREWISQYGEYFLEVFVVENFDLKLDNVIQFTNVKNAGIIGEMMLVSNGDLREKQEIRINWLLRFLGKEIVTETDFLLRGNNEYRSLSRSIDGFKLPLMQRGRYWYHDADSLPELSGTFCPLSDGFWCAKSESMLYALMLHNFAYVAIRSLEENHEKKRKDLKREFIKGYVRLSVENMAVCSNKLYINWQIENLSQKK